MSAILQLADGRCIPLTNSDLEFWDYHALPFGAVIVGDHRKLLAWLAQRDSDIHPTDRAAMYPSPDRGPA